MEDFLLCDLDFEDQKLSDLVYEFKGCFLRERDNFAKLCFTIHSIWSYCKGNYWKAKDNEYYNSYKLLAKFGFDKKAVSRYKHSFEKFIQGTNIVNSCVKTYFKDFSPSKLFEMLPLSDETIVNAIDNKLIKPEMTCKQIRDFVKSLRDGVDNADQVVEDTVIINEEDIPLAYDPKKKYEYSYFESKTKNQLLNIVWELQKAYQKLKSKNK